MGFMGFSVHPSFTRLGEDGRYHLVFGANDPEKAKDLRGKIERLALKQIGADSEEAKNNLAKNRQQL